MKERLAFTKGRWIGFACSALLPVLAMGLGVWLLATGTVLNISFAFTYLLLPLTTIGMLVQYIFSKREWFLKKVAPVAVVISFVMVFFFSAVFSIYARAEHYEGAKAELRYSEVTRKYSLMPDWSEVGQPVAKEYHHTFIQKLFFFSETDFFICRYTPEDYALEKAELETEYVFQTEPIRDHHYKDVLPTAEVDGYQFRVLSLEEYKGQLDYPKKLLLIGYSDEAKEIVYAFFYDTDLDCMESLQAFIMDEFGWEHIR